MNDDLLSAIIADYPHPDLIRALSPATETEATRLGVVVSEVQRRCEVIYKRRMLEAGLLHLAEVGLLAPQSAVLAAIQKDRKA